MGNDEITWKDFVSAVAEMFEPLARAAEALAEYGRISADDIVFEGYAPIEYARRICNGEIVREIFRPGRYRNFRISPCSCSVPGMIRKKGRLVKRGGSR